MPHGPLGDRIPFEGVLNCWNDDHDLPDLLLAISRSGKTGRLHFSNPEGDKTLDLCGSKIVFAESSSQDDGLGQYLLRTGQISLMDYTRVSRLVQPGKRLGALLVEENVLAEEDLVPAVVGQVRAVILGLFRRTETWYRFKEEELEEKESITLDLSVPELILEGVRYVESWRRVSKGVGSLESVYQQAAAREEEWLSSELDDDVRELVDMLATPTTLQEICTRATLQDFEACRYLWAFRALGWIDLVDEAEVSATDASDAHVDEAEAEVDAEKDAPAITPADTPTLPSIAPPVAAQERPGLHETQLAIDPPTAPEPGESPQASPAEIPERLIQTQVSVTPTDDDDDLFEEPTSTFGQPAPRPIPEHLNQTQLAVDAPPAHSPEPRSIPEHLTQTQIAGESPPAAKPAPTPDERMHTQMFVEAPPDAPAAPRSTGEFMESILEGEDPPSPTSETAPPEPPAPEPPPMQTKPPQQPQANQANQATTQFFDGPNALDPMDADLATAPAPEPPSPPAAAPPAPTTEPPAPPEPSPPPAAPAPPAPPATTGTPSGFEALALGGGPDGPSLARPSQPTPPIAPPTPSPAEVVTQPSVQPPPPVEADGMASFSDLALPEPPAEPPVPLVEAEVITAEPAPPPAPEFTPDEPLLPPSVTNSQSIERESLIPPRRHKDEVVTDRDDFGHVLGNDD